MRIPLCQTQSKGFGHTWRNNSALTVGFLRQMIEHGQHNLEDHKQISLFESHTSYLRGSYLFQRRFRNMRWHVVDPQKKLFVSVSMDCSCVLDLVKQLENTEYERMIRIPLIVEL